MKPRFRLAHAAVLLTLVLLVSSEDSRYFTYAERVGNDSPTPLLSVGHPVDWWFVFKFNTKAFPGCGDAALRMCPFGGNVRNYKAGFGQQFVYASSDDASLKKGTGCAGDSTADPIGATFDEVYNSSYHYVVWNDQFYDDPTIRGCTKECGSPWGHSKGLVAWNEAGQGFVLQVTTPSWPASGSRDFPRKSDGNTLGCVIDDDVEVSQHFFALKLTKDDLLKLLGALHNASVVTDPANQQIVNNGGPPDIEALVAKLGIRSDSEAPTKDLLSSGVVLLSKPSRLHVPPWQMVSALLDGASLRTATWWAKPMIYTTTGSSPIACWSDSLGTPGPVEIATTGEWEGATFGLKGGSGPNFNHAKLGVSLSVDRRFAIFGDMNQQGSLSGPNCASSQNGRGGLFYVVDNGDLAESVGALIRGDTAPSHPTN